MIGYVENSLKLLPYITLVSGVALWSYLKLINWTVLFYESALSGPGLVFLLSVAIVFFGLVLFMFLIPSLMMAVTEQLYNARKIPAEVLVLHWSTLILWCLSFWVLVPAEVSNWFVFGVPAVAGLMVARLFKNNLTPPEATPKLPHWVIGHTVLALLSSVSTVFPMIVAFGFASEIPGLAGSNEEKYVIGFCIAVTLVGAIPGTRFLAIRTKTIDTRQALMSSKAGVWLLAYFLFVAAVFLFPVKAAFLKRINLYSDKQTTFQILTTNLVPALRAAGMPVTAGGQDNNQAAAPGQNEFVTVRGYVRYRFGPVLLLCRDYVDPFATPRRAAIAAGTEKPTVRGSDCIPTREGDLRELRLSSAAQTVR